jgi:hypothetical protein
LLREQQQQQQQQGGEKEREVWKRERWSSRGRRREVRGRLLGGRGLGLGSLRGRDRRSSSGSDRGTGVGPIRLRSHR